jgi:uncharacterized RDD family membrane protein YckC
MILLGFISPWQYIIILMVIASLPVIALIDIIKNEFTGSNKLIWVIVVLLLPLLGTILYFLLGSQQKINKK